MSSERKQYNSDISDNQWGLVQRFIPKSKAHHQKGGRPEKYSRREILNTILYVLENGCKWGTVPHDLPPGGISWYWINQWSQERVFIKINRSMRTYTRKSLGKEVSPTLLIIDPQTAKSTSITRDTGYDAGKKVKGRKRHHVIDTNGIIIHTKVHPANIQDRDGAKLLLSGIPNSIMKTVQKIVADGGYAGKLVGCVKRRFGITLEIVKRNELHKFVVVPKRWIIERTNAWMYGAKRLAKECEQKMLNQESMIYLRMNQILWRSVI
jgi:putative transposase